MNALLVLAVTIGLASADVSSLGYHYNVPQTTYGTSSHQTGSSSNNYNTGYASTGSSGSGFTYKGTTQGFKGVSGGQGVVSYPTASAGSVYQGAGGAGYQSGVSSGYQSGVGTGYQSGVGSGYQTGSSGSDYQSGVGTGYQSGVGSGYQTGSSGSGYQTGGAGTGFQSGSAGSGYQSGSSGSRYQSGSVGSGFQSGNVGYQSSGSAGSGLGSFVGGSGPVQGFQSSNQYQSQYQQTHQQQIQYQQQPAQVFKHFYVHAAPEDQEFAKPRNPVVLPPAQKHYKIIFIKTPSAAGGATQVAPVIPQTEEKTIVYVLVKKPEEYQDLVVPKVDQKPPSKPEVYFIKYKNKEDSQAVINNIVSDYNKGQQSVSFSGIGTDAGSVSAGGSGFATSGASETSGASAFSGGSGLTGSSGFTGSSGLSGVSVSSTSSGVSESGSYTGQYNLGNTGSSGGSYVVQSSTESGANGLSFGQDSGSPGTASFVSSGYNQGSGSLGGVTISKSEPVSQGVTTGYESSDLASGLTHGVVGSSTVNYDVGNVISSSQGVPHETYGIPTFKSK